MRISALETSFFLEEVNQKIVSFSRSEVFGRYSFKYLGIFKRKKPLKFKDFSA
jgi:hypothetical protein